MRKLFLIVIALIASESGFCAALPSGNHSKKNKSQLLSESDGVITNAFLTVSYNPMAKKLEVSSKSTGKTFLKNGIPNGVIGSVKKKKITSPAFGKGNALVIMTADGGEFSFALYPSSLFCL